MVIRCKDTIWCNCCKLKHRFMRCTPYCNRCGRKHKEFDQCPHMLDFCEICNVSHGKETCPQNSQIQPQQQQQQHFQTVHVHQSAPHLHKTPKTVTSLSLQPLSLQPSTSHDNIYECPDNCSNSCCKPVHFYMSPDAAQHQQFQLQHSEHSARLFHQIETYKKNLPEKLTLRTYPILWRFPSRRKWRSSLF